MKRSQMIAMIRQKLVGTAIHGPPLNALSPEFPEQMLMFMEQLGMEPPKVRIMLEHYNRAEGEHGFLVNEWEEE